MLAYTALVRAYHFAWHSALHVFLQSVDTRASVHAQRMWLCTLYPFLWLCCSARFVNMFTHIATSTFFSSILLMFYYKQLSDTMLVGLEHMQIFVPMQEVAQMMKSALILAMQPQVKYTLRKGIYV